MRTDLAVSGCVGLLFLASGVAAGCGSASDTGGFDDRQRIAPPGNSSGLLPTDDGGTTCLRKTCAELGWACGYTVDDCGHVTNCADEGRGCSAGEVCIGGIDGPTKCVAGTAGGGSCEVCSAIPDCTGKPQKTRLTGRVVSPGRNDANTANQVGVPNATVYILQTTNVADIPASTAGIPAGGTSCDRCNEQNLGPVLVGAITDAAGNYTLEGNVPVGKEFLLVVKAGRFRRVVKQTIAAGGACATTTLPSTLPANPTRLPRHMTDGLAVNIPKIAITTGEIDAMECVFAKMGIAVSEFGNPGTSGSAAQRVHLYRGGRTERRGMKINDSTPHDPELYDSLARLQNYDMLVADCEGANWDNAFAQRIAAGANVREYVNRGGRMFASHLSFTWLHGNGTTVYAAGTPVATGLGPAATWDTSADADTKSGNGQISLGRPRASKRIQNFADWMERENVVDAPPPLNFTITQPRSQATAIGASSEEFVYLTDETKRIQQFSFNTPYGAPDAAACGRVAYSGFHVVADSGSSPYLNTTFASECGGNLTPQEKVLLYMLFDLGACVGASPLPPTCTPATCESLGARCGFAPDGCGQLLDCGPCTGPK